jgi:hypothetical protein
MGWFLGKESFETYFCEAMAFWQPKVWPFLAKFTIFEKINGQKLMI